METELQMINRHIMAGERLIAEQELRIVTMVRRGHPTHQAHLLLLLLKDTQRLHYEHLERYLQQHP